MASKKKMWLKCADCGKTDKTEKGYIGTQPTMVCPDCNKGNTNKYGAPLAQLCRGCCPTGHGTHFE